MWTAVCIHAFDELKSHLQTTPILAFPDFIKPFIFNTDVCQYGIGAVLSQQYDGEEKVFAYGSRLLVRQRRSIASRKRIFGSYVFSTHFRSHLFVHTPHGS